MPLVLGGPAGYQNTAASATSQSLQNDEPAKVVAAAKKSDALGARRVEVRKGQ